MFSQSTHPGNMPIRVLQFNVLNKFEQEGLKSIPAFAEAIKNGLVSPGIHYDIAKGRLKSPYASCDKKTIHIQEVFLSFMWSLSYSLFIIVDKGVQERVIRPDWKGEVVFDTNLLFKAKELLDWSLILNAYYDDWDLGLPNPERPNNEQEQFYCEKVNGIFENATCYILFHEYAHLALNHCDYSNSLKARSIHELSPEEKKTFKRLEEQADDFAFSSLINGTENETEKLHKGVGIIIAHCAMLFMVHTPEKLTQVIHPDTDHRLENSISKLKLEDPLNDDYIWTIGCLACMEFFNIHKIPFSPIPREPKVLFKDYITTLQRIKN